LARVSESDVRDIMPDSELQDEDVTPFLTGANLIVTQQLGGSGLPDALLAEIERWVAAHFVSAKDKQVRSESIGGVTQSYQTGNAASGLGTTVYGERALLMDPTGRLARMGRLPASFGVADYGVAHDPS
jgi:hypothetical protein